MTKKVFFIFIITFALFGFISCQKDKKQNLNTSTNVSAEVSDTKVTIDISDKNNTAVFVSAGDTLLGDFITDEKQSLQWSYKEPISGGYLILKEHILIREGDARIESGQHISRWKMKVLKNGIFTVRFHKENSLKPQNPELIFRVKVVSGQTLASLNPILIDTPKNDELLTTTIFMSGFENISGKTLHWRIIDDNKSIVAQNVIDLIESNTQYQYFEKPFALKKMDIKNGILELYELTEDKTTQRHTVSIPVRFQ